MIVKKLTEANLPRFALGQVVGTPGAIETLKRFNIDALTLLKRHVTGDWGDLDDDDKAENDLAVGRDLRIFSAYNLSESVKVWVITEADRSVTTILLPEEY